MPLSVDGLAAAGRTLGAGVLIFVGIDTCPIAELTNVARWLADESTKQCGPCAFGLPAIADDIAGLLGPEGSRAESAQAGSAPTRRNRMRDTGTQDSGLLARATRHTGSVVGRGACAHPDGTSRFVRSGLALCADDIATHRAYGSCRRGDLGYLALTRAAAMTERRSS